MADSDQRLPISVIHLISWPSLALGIAATFRPTQLASLLGLEPAEAAKPIRWAGRRELLVLAAFLARPVRRSLWMFIGQDAFDLIAGSLAVASDLDVVRSRRRLAAGYLGYALLAAGDVGVMLRERKKCCGSYRK